MNAESSRSHLIIGIVIVSTNLTNGTVHKGKVRYVCRDWCSYMYKNQCILNGAKISMIVLILHNY